MTARLKAVEAAAGAEGRPTARRYSAADLDRIWARLDERLIILALRPQLPPEEQKLVTVDTAGLTINADKAAVIVRAGGPDSTARTLVERAGGRVDAASSVPGVVVAEVPLARLLDLALADGIVRIDPLPAR